MNRNAGKSDGTDGAPRLSPEAAFVIQLASEAMLDDGRVSGRVEHLATGTSEPFETIGELLGFMKRLRGARRGSARAV